MKIYAYGSSETGKSEWVKRIGGTEKEIIIEDHIEEFPIVYVRNEECPDKIKKEFNMILKFTKNEVIVEKI